MEMINKKDLTDALQREIFQCPRGWNMYEEGKEIDEQEIAYQEGYYYGLDHAHYIIDTAPTIDAIPVRHGRWVYKGVRGRFPVCECSVCGNTENADWAVLGDNVNYCPNCGAKMDLDEV